MLVDPQRVGEIGKESPNEPSGTHRWVARKTAGLKRTPQTPASPLLHYAPAIVYDATTGEWYGPSRGCSISSASTVPACAWTGVDNQPVVVQAPMVFSMRTAEPNL